MVKSLDFFGPSLNFTIQNTSNFKSVFGGLVSLIVYSLYFVFFLLFAKDMIYRQNPNVSWETLMENSKEHYKINNETFMAWRIENFDAIPFNHTNLFYINFVYKQINYTETYYAHTNLKFINCSLNPNFSRLFKESSYNEKEWFCLDFSNVIEKPIYLDLNSEAHISLEMDICDFDIIKKKKRNCNDYKEIGKLLSEQDLFLGILYFNIDFNPNNFEQPLQKTLKKIFNKININQIKYDVIYYQKFKVTQDDAILFSNEREIDNLYGFYKFELYSDFRSDKEIENYYKTDYYHFIKNIYNFVFYVDPTVKNYSRKYLKIQDVFANVNGLMEFLIFILSFIKIYTNYRFDYFLFNELVNVRKAKSEVSNPGIYQDKSSQINKYIDINYSKGKKSKQNNLNSIPREIEKIKMILDETNNILNKNPNSTYSVINKKDFIEINNNICSEPNSSRRFNKVDKQDFFIIDNLNKNQIPINDNFKNNYSNFNIDDRRKVNLDIEKNLTMNNEKKINEINSYIQRLERLIEIKPRYLVPNFYNFLSTTIAFKICNLCKSQKENKKKNFDISMLEFYKEKINKKFDIFNYLKWYREFSNIKSFILSRRNEKTIFEILAKNFYEIKIDESYDEKLFEKTNKNLKENIKEWVKNMNDFLEPRENKFLNYVFKKLEH